MAKRGSELLMTTPLEGEPVAPRREQGPQKNTSGDALVAPLEPTTSPDPAVPSTKPGPGRK
jgi:hypothetical protein